MKKNPRKTESLSYAEEERGACLALCRLAECKDVSVENGRLLAEQILESRFHELPDKQRRAIMRKFESAIALAEDILG